jgi:4-diphosphocytidyl-2-C-methyl-D-erythritol kinase
MKVTVRSPAKVNLQLSVGGLREDGFHDVVSVYQAVSMFDEVSASAVEPGHGLTVTVTGEGSGSVPTDATNLAVRAGLLLAEHAGCAPDARLHITKGIPVAGGMAGGSADAAAALLALDVLWDLHLDRSTLTTLAARLGSDVPFALMGHTAVGTGRGEQLTPALARGRFEWVMALADGGLSTPEVYAELDRLRGSRQVAAPEVSGPLMTALRAGDPHALGPALRNDLQRASVSLRPSLAMTLEVGEEYSALACVVSGSGPTCAFLARDEEHALDLAVALTSSGVCRTVRRASGPVAGARVVTG